MNLMSENINELMASLSKAQGQMNSATKDSNNPFFNSKYADLNSIWNACRQALSCNGLAVIQTMTNDENGDMALQTILGHSSGQWVKSFLPIKMQLPKEPKIGKDGKPKEVNELQLLGSSLTYLRRYALAAIVGVAPDEDDDGNTGGQHYKSNQYTSYTKRLDEEKSVKKITKSEADNLAFILDECEEKYRTWVYDHLLKQYKITTLSELPFDLYERMKSAAEKNMEIHRSKQRQQPELLLQEIQ